MTHRRPDACQRLLGALLGAVASISCSQAPAPLLRDDGAVDAAAADTSPDRGVSGEDAGRGLEPDAGPGPADAGEDRADGAPSIGDGAPSIGDAAEADAAPEALDAAIRDASDGTDGAADARTTDAGAADAGAADARPPDPTRSFRVVTFNTGTSGGARHDLPPDDGYGSDEAAICNEWYGNGLSWLPLIEDTRAFFAAIAPDVVVFQEIFHPPECLNIPAQYHPGFVCERWRLGDLTVAQEVLGPGWQIACNLGKPDKCAAVRRSFGSFRGCSADLCLDGLDGARVQDCGFGSRIGRGTIDLVNGGTLTVVNVHGSSGILAADEECRVRQFEQVFVDLGDGQPAANGARNVIMGDFNTDPARNAWFDQSAERLNDFVGSGEPFHFISEVGSNAPPSYSGLFNIDHVISDVFAGDCFIPGITSGHPAVSGIDVFDHKPQVCDLHAP